MDFGIIEEPAALGARMSRIPGLVEHGIFDNLDELYLARAGGVEVLRRKQCNALPSTTSILKGKII